MKKIADNDNDDDFYMAVKIIKDGEEALGYVADMDDKMCLVTFEPGQDCTELKHVLG